MIPEIDYIAARCLNVKKYLPGKPLSFLYKIFNESKFNKLTLKLIKQNLLD